MPESSSGHMQTCARRGWRSSCRVRMGADVASAKSGESRFLSQCSRRRTTPRGHVPLSNSAGAHETPFCFSMLARVNDPKGTCTSVQQRCRARDGRFLSQCSRRRTTPRGFETLSLVRRGCHAWTLTPVGADANVVAAVNACVIWRLERLSRRKWLLAYLAESPIVLMQRDGSCPHARHHLTNSTGSIRRSPVSVLWTNVCGFLSRWPSSR